MTSPFLSIAPHTPPGFERREPTKRELLGGVVLFVESLQATTELMPDFLQRVPGLVVTEGESCSVQRVGPELHHLVLATPMIDHARDVCLLLSELTNEGHDALHRLSSLEIELRRSETLLEEFRQDRNTNLDGLRHKVAELAQEVKERARVEALLRESEEKYCKVVENANDAIFITQEGRVVFHNERTLTLFGCSREGLARLPTWDFIHPDDKALALESFTDSSSTFRILHQDGTVVFVNQTAAPVTWQAGPATLHVLRDVSNKERLEQSLRQAQRMESIGTLAGGIAHNFNNILMAIQGHVSLMLDGLPEDSELRASLAAVSENVSSAAALTKQILGFSRAGKVEVRVFDLNELVTRSARMFAQTRKEIDVKTEISTTCANVRGDREQLEQVLLNLYINAWQAMPCGGNLYITTEHIQINDRHESKHELKPGAYVKITVSDTGGGIARSDLDRVFDPFFTTKDSGTGLGLASAYGTVMNHSGCLTVESQAGQGTVFTILLPLSKQKPTPLPKAAANPIPGDATILVVDDHRDILSVSGAMLERLGYNVLLAPSGQVALELVRDHPGSIDLVILDLIMPGLGGAETFNRIHQIAPALPVLISSGYSIDDEIRSLLDRGAAGYLGKPFRLSHLSSRINAILEASDTPFGS